MPQSRKSLLQWASDRRGCAPLETGPPNPSTPRGSVYCVPRRARARKLRYWLNELIPVADSRLGVADDRLQHVFPSRTAPTGLGGPPCGASPWPCPACRRCRASPRWASEVTLFHDCQHSELTLRQLRNLRGGRPGPLSACGWTFSVSTARSCLWCWTMPPEAVQGLTPPASLCAWTPSCRDGKTAWNSSRG